MFTNCLSLLIYRWTETSRDLLHSAITVQHKLQTQLIQSQRVYLSTYSSIHLLIYLSTYLPIYLSTYPPMSTKLESQVVGLVFVWSLLWCGICLQFNNNFSQQSVVCCLGVGCYCWLIAYSSTTQTAHTDFNSYHTSFFYDQN